MKLSRIIRRRRYRQHRRGTERKIDLFADGKVINPNLLEHIEPVLTETEDETVVLGSAKQNSHEPTTVREAFEAFKRSQQEI